ncbi:MAG: TIR domain-containing protein [Sulfuricella sp.]
MLDKFDFDVFVSYSSKDADRVIALAQRLSEDGLAVWLDKWKISPGDNIPLKIEDALEKSRTLLLTMSANSLGSEWARLERSAVLFRDPTNETRRFIPIRFDDSEIPESLRQFAYVDWRLESIEEYSRLVVACKPKKQHLPQIAPERQLTPKNFQQNIVGVAASMDGSVAISASPPNLVSIWNVRKGSCSAELVGHAGKVNAVAIAGDGSLGFSCSADATIAVWDIHSKQKKGSLKGHVGPVTCLATNSLGGTVVSGGGDRTIRIWEVQSGRCVTVFEETSDDVTCVGIDGKAIHCISGTSDGILRVWDVMAESCIAALSGHTLGITALSISADGNTAVTASKDRTLRVWSLKQLRCVAVLEGHTGSIEAVTITADGGFVASSATDKTIRLWNIPAGDCVAILEGHTSGILGLSITSDGRTLISGSTDHTMRVWDLSKNKNGMQQIQPPTRYTNAKVLLVGQSGVGKTGLALRLTEDRFEASVSSDGAWATQMKIPYSQNDSREDREIWLWDFAGQSDYRLIHQLFMDETALAVLVFNPQDENPFEVLAQWDNDIQRAATRPFKKILVAGRCDRGGAIISKDVIQRFVEERDFSCFLETSARSGERCQELRELIIQTIPWTEMPWTASPRIFRLLKNEILSLRDHGHVLIRLVELKQQLELRLPRENFSVDQLRAVIGLLTGPGIVRQLEFGDFVLLRPEYVNAYASAVVRTVRSHVDEIGSIFERDVIDGKLKFEDMVRLPHGQESAVLREMHQMFIDRGLCLREHSDAGDLLIFPSYFKRERKDIDHHPAPFIIFSFSGSLDEVYATLVVRLLHTTMVQKDALWKWAADFRTPSNKRVGIKIIKKPEGTADLVVYFEPDVSDDIKVTFVRYVYDHLRSKDSNLSMARYYVCPQCGEAVESLRAVEERKKRGSVDIPCSFCDTRIPLVDLIEEKFQSPEIQEEARRMERTARTDIDNESKELILVGHAFSISGEAGQIFRPTANSDWGIDGEIEFKDENGQATGKRVYLQLKSGDSYLRTRSTDGKVIFRVSNKRHLVYWKSHNYPVMLVVRTSDGQIQWMNISRYLRDHKSEGMYIEFEGEVFNAASLLRFRDKELSLVGIVEALAVKAGHRFSIIRLMEWGVDGQIELLDSNRKRVGFLLLQLRPEVLYVRRNSPKGKTIYTADYPRPFGQSNLPHGRVMLVARSQHGEIQWMDISKQLRQQTNPLEFAFEGEQISVAAIDALRDKMQKVRDEMQKMASRNSRRAQ